MLFSQNPNKTTRFFQIFKNLIFSCTCNPNLTKNSQALIHLSSSPSLPITYHRSRRHSSHHHRCLTFLRSNRNPRFALSIPHVTPQIHSSSVTATIDQGELVDQKWEAETRIQQMWKFSIPQF